MDFLELQANIVIFSVEKSLCKEHSFKLNIAEFRVTVFAAIMLSLGILQYLSNPTAGIENSLLYQ